MNKLTFAATVAVAALTAVAPAFAEAVSTGQWYTSSFGTDVPSGVGAGNSAGFDGPLPGGGTQTAVLTTDGPNYTINMASDGYLVVTDVEAAGDQFSILVNGVAATPTTNNLTPTGQAGLANGWTSNPNSSSGDYVGEDIGAALADSNFSSGTFDLPTGADTITITYQGSIGGGNVDFYADTAAPEPGTILLLGSALAGLGMLRRRKKA